MNPDIVGLTFGDFKVLSKLPDEPVFLKYNFVYVDIK